MAILKRWAVRQIASFLSDYLDGVSEQNLQASLSSAVGEVEIRHVRIQPGLLAEKHLKLLSSDVSVSARIPWRNLGSEPTVFTVRDVWVEACTEVPSGLSSGADAEEALERWRLRKAREVQSQVEAALAAAITPEASDTGGQRRSIATRLGHAALRQLQVRVEGLHFRLHSEKSSGSTLELRCRRLALDEGGAADRRGTEIMQVPADFTRHPANLNKAFELSSLSASLIPGSDCSSPSSRGRSGGVAQALRQELATRQAELARAQGGGGGGAAAVEARELELGEAKSRLRDSLSSEATGSQKAAMDVVGPLSLGARLWHSSAAGLLWLALKLQIDQPYAAVILTPEVVRFARSCFDWYVSVIAAPPSVQQRSDALKDGGVEGAEVFSATEYIELCTRQLRGDSYDEARMREIEDLESVQFLVRCRLRCHEQHETPSAASQTVSSSGGGSSSGVMGWLQRRWRGKEDVKEAPQQDSDDEEEDELDEEAGMEGMLPEVEEPHLVKVSLVIPLCDIVRCRLDSGAAEAGSLRAVGGVNCQGTIKSAGSAAGPWLVRAWDADVGAELLSLAVLLDSEPLMLLQQSLDNEPLILRPPSIEVEGDGEKSSAGSSCSFKSIEDETEEQDDDQAQVVEENEMLPAVKLELACKHKGGGSGLVQASLPRWSVQVRLRQEPFRFMLGPWSLRSALSIVTSVLQSGQQACAQSRVENDTSEDSLQERRPSVGSGSNVKDSTVEVSEGDNSLALDLDLDVAAPVLRWGLAPQGQIIVSLGRLLFRTCSVTPPPTEEIVESSICTWNAFACQCQFTATSVTVHAEDSECLVYKPTTICVRAWRDAAGDSGWQFGIDADVVQWTVTPTVLRAVGQMPLSLDYALTPLRDMLAEVLSGSTSPEVIAEPGRRDSIASIATTDSSRAQRPTLYSKRDGEEAAEIDVVSSRPIVGRNPAHADDLQANEEAPQVKVHVSIRSFSVSLTPSDVHGGAATALLFEGIEAEYSARRHCVDTLGKVEGYSLIYDSTPVGKCAEGGSFKVRNSDSHIALDGRSAMIEFAWRVQPMRGVLTTLDRACGCLTAGRDTAKELLLVGESAGMSAQLWSRLVNERIQAQLQHQANVRLAELLPGLSGLDKHPSSDAVVNIPESDQSDSIPQVNSDCTVDLSLCCDGVTIVFPDTTGMDLKSMQVAVTGAECVVRGFRSGDATADVSLLTIDLELRGRRLLTPRRAGKLLQVRVVRLVLPQPVVHWTASWAQVCILYRQRDHDALRSFLQENVSDVISSLQTTSSSSKTPAAKPVDEDSSPVPHVVEDSSSVPQRQLSRESRGSIVAAAPARYFRLDVGAPRVFLPTDKAMLRSPGSRKGSGIGGGGGELVIDSVSGEPGFQPEAGEGLMVFDFGHVTAMRGSANEADDCIDLRLRGAHVLGITECGAPLQEILCPASVNATLKTGGPLEFHMTSIVASNEDKNVVEDTSKTLAGTPRQIDHRMSFTRAQLTLLFDVLAENISYTGRLAKIQTLKQQVSGSSGEWVRYVVEAATVPGRGFKFSWSWPGELVLCVAFTQEVPLVRFSLTGGLFAIESSNTGSLYLLRCRYFSADDLRIASRNCNRKLLICTELDSRSTGFEVRSGEAGFEVRSESPADGDARTVIRLGQPVLQTLPQLIMDVVTYGMSSWQQSTYSRQNNQPPSDEEVVRTTSATVDEIARCHKIEVNFINAAFRVMSQWSEPAEYFEFAGSLFIALSIDADCIRTERADLKGGCLRLTSLLRNEPSTLIPCLEWTVQAKQTRKDDNKRMRRHSTILLKPVVIRPYAIRISAQDHHAMVGAFMELLSFDAETAEPSAEIEGRDPLALQVESRFTIEASVELQGVEVQVLDEEGGHAWPGMKAHASTKMFDATVELKPGVAPTINLFAKEFEIGVSAHNHRLGTWEPVLPPCQWHLSHHRQRKPDGGPREVLVHSNVYAAAQVDLIVSPSTVHLAKRIFSGNVSDMSYGHLLAGLNLSGNSFRITSEHSDECILEATASMTPLDWLLKGSIRRDGKPAQPWLTLTIMNNPKAKALFMDLSRETSVKWDTGTAGVLVCRLIMLRPPQRILMVSSTVCVCNRTPTDLEVRFVKPDDENEPILLTRMIHSVDSRCVDSDQSVVTGIQGACITSGSDGGFKLGAGQMLYAPVEAQRDAGDVVMQVRPALDATGGIAYAWSSSFPTGPLNGRGQSQATLCSAPPPEFGNDLPPHWLHLRSCRQASDCRRDVDASDCRRDVDILAPFTIFNACPCDIFCWLNPVCTRTRLGVERDTGIYGDLVVHNGRGGYTHVQAGIVAEVFPVVLDANGYFYYHCSKETSKIERAKPRWPTVNCIHVQFDARRGVVDWTCFHVEIAKHPSMPPRLNPQSVLPVFDLVAEELYISLALKEHNCRATTWSLPLHAETSDTHAIEESVELAYKGMRVLLCTHRVRRQLVVYTRCWFVNSTGLDVQIQQPGGPGRLHPVPFFAENITFLPELTDKNTGDTIVYLEYGSEESVTACIPDVGGDEAVSLTPRHPCCLRTEKVTLGQPDQAYARHHVFYDLSSRLVTLLPAILLFNRTAYAIGFRQVFSGNREVWLEPGKSGTFWWHNPENRRLQISAKIPLENTERESSDRRSNAVDSYDCQSVWSSPFQLEESTIGSYPVALESGPSARLMCISIDQEGCIFSVAVHKAESCHMLVNQHPSLMLRASLEGAANDPRFYFKAAYGESVAVAGKEPFGGKRQIHLVLETASNVEERVAVTVDLNRAQIYNVPLENQTSSAKPSKAPAGKSTLRVPAHVLVELRNRVAHVTIRPASSSHDINSNKSTTNLELSHLRIALLTEGAAQTYGDLEAESQRREAFTVALSGVRVEIYQMPNRRRDVNFRILNAHVTLQHPQTEVVLANVTQPFLETRSVRDDAAMLDVHMRNVKLLFGELEVSLTDGAIAQAQLLARNLARDSGGLNFSQISSRVGLPYHQIRREPPPASSKLVLGNLDMGHLTLNVWCRIHLPDAYYIPKALRDTIQMVSLGNNLLDVKAAQVKVPQQSLFSIAPAEGSPVAVLARVWDHYLPHVKASWRSLVTHSNLILGGSLRHFWAPREKRKNEPILPICLIGRAGELTLLPMETPVSVAATSGGPLRSLGQHFGSSSSSSAHRPGTRSM